MSETRAFFELLAMLVLDPRSGALLALLVAAAVTDWRTRRIPNELTLAGALCGLALGALHGPTIAAGLAQSAGGCAVGLLLPLPLYLLRVLGAGDVKLMAMAGAFLGPWSTLHALFYVVVAGGVLALVFTLARGALRELLSNLRFILLCYLSPAAAGNRLSLAASAPSVGRMPYGLAICAGLVAYLVVRQFGFA